MNTKKTFCVGNVVYVSNDLWNKRKIEEVINNMSCDVSMTPLEHYNPFILPNSFFCSYIGEIRQLDIICLNDRF